MRIATLGILGNGSSSLSCLSQLRAIRRGSSTTAVYTKGAPPPRQSISARVGSLAYVQRGWEEKEGAWDICIRVRRVAARSVSLRSLARANVYRSLWDMLCCVYRYTGVTCRRGGRSNSALGFANMDFRWVSLSHDENNEMRDRGCLSACCVVYTHVRAVNDAVIKFLLIFRLVPLLIK